MTIMKHPNSRMKLCPQNGEETSVLNGCVLNSVLVASSGHLQSNVKVWCENISSRVGTLHGLEACKSPSFQGVS